MANVPWEKRSEMDWVADLRCRRCENLDPERILPDMDREEALMATLDCPSCELEEGEEVVESTLKKYRSPSGRSSA